MSTVKAAVLALGLLNVSSQSFTQEKQENPGLGHALYEISKEIGTGITSGLYCGGVTIPLITMETVYTALDHVADNMGYLVKNHIHLAGELTAVGEIAYLTTSLATMCVYVALVYTAMTKIGAGPVIAVPAAVVPILLYAGNLLGMILSHQARDKQGTSP